MATTKPSPGSRRDLNRTSVSEVSMNHYTERIIQVDTSVVRILLIGVIALSWACGPDTNAPQQVAPPAQSLSPGQASRSGEVPGGIRLLPGYSHESIQGIDTRVGRIWKDGGPTIRYDIGWFAGNHASNLVESTKYSWSIAHAINGRRFRLTMENTERLVVTFEQDIANFFASPISDQQDLAEVLLMLLTYNPQESPATRDQDPPLRTPKPK